MTKTLQQQTKGKEDSHHPAGGWGPNDNQDKAPKISGLDAKQASGEGAE